MKNEVQSDYVVQSFYGYMPKISVNVGNNNFSIFDHWNKIRQYL